MTKPQLRLVEVTVVPFAHHSDPVRARELLEREVEAVLEALARGVLPDVAEREHVDCEEEAG